MTLPNGFFKTGQYCGECNNEMLYSYHTDQPECKNPNCSLGRLYLISHRFFGESKLSFILRNIKYFLKGIVNG